MREPKYLVVDLFCGAGGTSTGFHMADGLAEVIACVNHDPVQIQSHWQNYPNVKHYEEDIRTLNLEHLTTLINNARRQYPNAQVILWASLECTNFSRAKGGMARDADSRTLAEHLHRYIDALNPDIIQIENVSEFMAWGPLDENGKPISMRQGEDYVAWVDSIKAKEYEYDYAMINAADHGAFTSRNRYFGKFVKPGIPIIFPQPTHAKKPELKPNQQLLRWNPVREKLDLDNHGKSIFNRKKDLVDNTLKRIYRGVKKFPPEEYGTNTFITTYYGNGGAHSIDEPMPTIPTRDRFAINHFVSSSYTSGDNNASIEQPLGTITGVPKQNIVSVQYLYDAQYNNTGRHLNQPCQTIIARQDKSPLYLITATFTDRDFTIPIYDTDTTMMRWLKRYMVMNRITDIKMRMTEVDELKVIQGFPEDYILTGPKTQQKKGIGNSVCPIVPKVWIEAMNAGSTW